MGAASTEESLAAGLAGDGGTSGEERVEREARALLESAYREARELLSRNEELLHRTAARLLEAEALDRDELSELLGARPEPRRLRPR
jgi:cell division protease FtsH